MPRKKYELRHFVEDYEATEWINSMDALGYDVVSMATCEVQNGRDRRDRDVQITVLMRLCRTTPLTPGQSLGIQPGAPAPCNVPLQQPQRPIVGDPPTDISHRFQTAPPMRWAGSVADMCAVGVVPGHSKAA